MTEKKLTYIHKRLRKNLHKLFIYKKVIKFAQVKQFCHLDR